jgi:hypothetical protein
MKDNISILDRARAHSSILMDNEGLAACQRSNEPVPVFRVLSSDKTTIGMRFVIFSWWALRFHTSVIEQGP